MRTILVSTTSLWNCGDDFIRTGLMDLLRLRRGVRTLWWNRAYGVSATYANDLSVNLRAADYVLVAGTPEWIDKNEKLYEACLRKGTPLSLIGVGLRGCVRTARQRRLLGRVASSGLVEVCTARDRVALEFLRDLGFREPTLSLDPAFFLPPLEAERTTHILGWRDMSATGPPLLRHPRAWLLWQLARKRRHELARTKSRHDRLLRDTFDGLPDPKLVIVHDNREIDAAQEMFGRDNVFYSSDHVDMLRTYSTAVSYVGSRIHGAVAALVHGAPVRVLYGNRKAAALEEAVRILGVHYPGMQDCVKVCYLTEDSGLAPSVETRALDVPAFRRAIGKERERLRAMVLESGELGRYVRREDVRD